MLSIFLCLLAAYMLGTQGRASVPAHVWKQSMAAGPLAHERYVFCSSQAFGRLDETHLHDGGPSALYKNHLLSVNLIQKCPYNKN